MTYRFLRAFNQSVADSEIYSGLVVVSLLAFQPILGLVHHYLFKKHHIRTFWSTAHVWFGRVRTFVSLDAAFMLFSTFQDMPQGLFARGTYRTVQRFCTRGWEC